MAEYEGIEFLRNRLRQKQLRVKLRYTFYESKNIAKDLGISTPDGLEWLKSCLGWNAMAVDSLADRISFKEFKNDNFNMNHIFSMNNPDVLVDSAVKGALISSCDFIYISVDDDGFPRLQVIDGYNATGIMDTTTMMLKEGYAVLERDTYDNHPTVEAYFIAGSTYYIFNGVMTREFRHNAPYPLLVPIVFRPDAVRPFGHSRISRASMELTSSALRTIKRSEIAAEFFSYPQKYVTGLDQDAEKMDKWKATISSLLTFTKDSNGDKPTLGQFQQQSMAPHLEQLEMFARQFAAENALTPEDLGITATNPSSYDALRVSHARQIKIAEKAMATFGTGLLNTGYLAVCLRDEVPYKREVFYETRPSWKPVYDIDAQTLAGLGDAILKINQAMPGYLTEDKIDEIIGL